MTGIFRFRCCVTVRTLQRIVLAAGIVAWSQLGAQGIRLDVGMFVIRPALAAQSSEVFAGLGGFRPGIGADFGIGYDKRDVGVTLSGAMAGVELGAPVTRNGIGMGRVTGIHNAAALVGLWRSQRRVGPWRPVFSAGYLRSSINNVLLRADSLPVFARALTPEPPDSVRRLAGVAGSGVRLGVSVERPISASDFSGRMLVSIDISGDIVRFGEVSYDGRRAPIPDPGTSVSPRLGVSFRWSPRIPPDS